MSLNEVQQHKLKRFIRILEALKGRHTELVSVYIPAGYEMTKIIGHLQDEQGTASNIKSASTRKNVISALEKMIQHLRVVGKTPPNGLAAFSGNVSEHEGKSDFRVWSIEPPVELRQRIYRCDKTFVLEPLQDMLEVKEAYGLVVMDRREATLGLLKGKNIKVLSKATSNVPGKTRAGGQCLSPDTLVMTADGEIISIAEAHNPLSLKNTDLVNHKISTGKIQDKWSSRKNKKFTIITKNPRLEITSSKDHIFFTWNKGRIKEKAAEALQIGDYLLFPGKMSVKGKTQLLPTEAYDYYDLKNAQELIRNARKEKSLLQRTVAKKVGISQTLISKYELSKRLIHKKHAQALCRVLQIPFKHFEKKAKKVTIRLPSILTKDLAQIIGYFIGDGNYDAYRLNFSEQRESIAQHYAHLLFKTFHLKPKIKWRAEKGYYQLRIENKHIVTFFKEFVIKDRIPAKILKSKNDVLASFVKGLADAEGCITTRGVSIGMNNKLLISQLQLALLRLDIIASVHVYDNRKNKYSKNYCYTLDITEKQSLELFAKHCDFSDAKKSKKLKAVCKAKSDLSKTRQFIYSAKTLAPLLESHGYKKKQFPTLSMYFNGKRDIAKKVIEKQILSKIKESFLKKQILNMINHPLIPTKIKYINVEKKMSSFIDITVQHENFFANGLLVHNSAQRFARIREGAAKDFFKKVADLMKDEFLFLEHLKGIIVGGPGHTKYDFIERGYITDQVKQKVISVKDVSYTNEQGLDELLEKSQDVLAKEGVAQEKQIMQMFFKKLREEFEKTTYGYDSVKDALKKGAVELMLISDAVEDETAEELEGIAQQFNSEVKIISTETKEGVQLREMGKIAAILRYPL